MEEKLYFLGYVAAIVFSVRFLIQWLLSEAKGKSLVPRVFWWLSMLGNVTLMTHGIIQLQYHVALIQGVNGVISWRNLNLMGKDPISFKAVLIFFGSIILAITAIFVFRDSFWFRVPTHTFQSDPTKSVPIFLHIIGIIGLALFNSRFLLQWWQSENAHKSLLSVTFWWLSISGGILSIIYFAAMWDVANLIGPLLGMVPYIRNLMLLRKAEAT